MMYAFCIGVIVGALGMWAILTLIAGTTAPRSCPTWYEGEPVRIAYGKYAGKQAVVREVYPYDGKVLVEIPELQRKGRVYHAKVFETHLRHG